MEAFASSDPAVVGDRRSYPIGPVTVVARRNQRFSRGRDHGCAVSPSCGPFGQRAGRQRPMGRWVACPRS
eukprot:8185521-Lingulodinium_polyedra.AAC.1